jgi:dipeptidyl aminopeptidase/acylaminoacyl peptidase
MTKAKRKITIEDLYEMKFVSDPQISPDGKQIAYVVKTVDKEDETKYQNHIWMVSTEEPSEPTQFTNVGKSETFPRWSPDGSKLAFLAKKGDNTQIYLVPVDGGAPLSLTNNDFNAGEPVWSPDGTKIAYAAKVFSKDHEKKDTDVKYITSLRYKFNGVGFFDGKVSQVHYTDVATGETKQLTEGEFACSTPAWSADSTKLAFSSNRTEDHEYNHFSDIYSCGLDGNLEKLTNTDGSYSSPAFSPNGKLIAYMGHQFEYSSATVPTMYVQTLDGSERFDFLPELDTAPRHGVGGDLVSSPATGITWTSNSKEIVFLASWHGKTAIYRKEVTPNANLVQVTNGDEALYGMTYCSYSDSYAVVRTTMTEIGDLFVIDADGTRTQLTTLNKDFLEEIHVSASEQFMYNAEGFDIEGWIMKPYGFEKGKKYPTVLHIHGGPHAAYGHAFFHEFQLLAAQGYVVVFTNPPGSTTYGQEFIIQTKEDWGGTDYRSLMAATEYVNENFNFVDKDKWGVTGGSYGGYMVNWMISQNNFFKAAVSARSTCNRYSMFGTSDVGFFNGIFEQKGNPWDNPEFYLKVSPITYVNNVETPVLLIHSEEDHRCPISQSEEFFTALKWLKKEVAMARFPKENHELSRSGQPKHRKERLRFIIDWFIKYLPA